MLPSRRRLRHYTQPTITCSKLTIETLEQRCEICSKLTIKPPERRHWRRSGGFIINFEHISHLCSSVSIVKLKHVNAGWEGTEEAIVSYSGKKKFLKYRQLL